MMNQNTRIATLIGRRLNGTITAAEGAELDTFMSVSAENRQFVEQYDDEEHLNKELNSHYYYDLHNGWMKLVERANLPFRAPGPVVRLKWIFPAVAAILVLAVLTWLLITPKKTTDTLPKTADVAFKNDIPPGGDRATLQLADGRVILLDSASNGALVHQGGTAISKSPDGSLRYELKDAKSEVLYNTLSTPKGGQYKLQLPDGSIVHLNAATTIRYPTSFVSEERKIDLISGEAYFIVAKNTKQPFRTAFNDGHDVVEVTGTEFNLSAYKDDNDMQTTLIEGRVKVNSRTESVTLKPGQQVSVSRLSKLSQPIAVQTDEIVAWKDGYFHFENKTIAEIMKTVSRWYDITVQYEFQPVEPYRVRLTRDVPISNVLQYLEAAGGVHFSIDGKTITVRK